MNTTFHEIKTTGPSAFTKDDRRFESVINKALKSMAEEAKAVSEKRQDYVISRLEEEMAKLRPRKVRLLEGVKPDDLP